MPYLSKMIWINFVDGPENGYRTSYIAKCKHLKYGSNASPYEYYMNEEGYNSKLNVISSEKDLGVWITSKPDFTLQCEKASAKAMQSLGLIKRTITNLTKESLQILYNTYVHSSTLRILCFNFEPILSKKH